jgi:hypothetical protein
MRVSPKGNRLELAIICALFVLLCLWGIVWDVTSGLLASGIDGIMLAAVCGMMALIFAAMLVLELQKAGIVPSFAHKSKVGAAPRASASAASAPAAKPAVTASSAAPSAKTSPAATATTRASSSASQPSTPEPAPQHK